MGMIVNGLFPFFRENEDDDDVDNDKEDDDEDDDDDDDHYEAPFVLDSEL
eukprot:CAMPEP_0170905210 /NCGR_PEP_ID=MMETSP0734-20130129/50889_1 /TAXON_ID=186038 /ORGANISM="Fragilariopsis kerguelensis, Strain L26-C5" /LENGTH=49 /DNA_ID=CAMNT_0011300869 /DNA_START=533 /DNA_END=683 /DNA_ORIENTATION=-